MSQADVETWVVAKLERRGEDLGPAARGRCAPLLNQGGAAGGGDQGGGDDDDQKAGRLLYNLLRAAEDADALAEHLGGERAAGLRRLADNLRREAEQGDEL